MHWRPPALKGRNELEMLFVSDCSSDWVAITEMLLGPVPGTFQFVPKHKSNGFSAPVVGGAEGVAPGRGGGGGGAGGSEAAMAWDEGEEQNGQ
jgi:tRNA-dihydrouridine synthase 3